MMSSSKILLVEGDDDEHVIKNLWRGKLHLDFKQFGGIDKLPARLPDELDASDVTALGVVVDADADASARWESVRNILVKAGYRDVPDRPDPNGTVIAGPVKSLLPRRLGVWIMPNNDGKGILEDFIREMIPGTSQLFQHAEASLNAIPKDALLFIGPKKPKALVHTWLAWQEEPGKPPGLGIKANYFDRDRPHVHVFISWMERLFCESETSAPD